jgi:hypothetical protein
VRKNDDSAILRFNFLEGHCSRGQILSFLDGFREALHDAIGDIEGQTRALASSLSVHHRLSRAFGREMHEQQLRWIARAKNIVGNQKRRPP